MKKFDVIHFCFLTIFGGLCIGLGGTSSLLANALMPGIWGKLIGASLFGLGLFLIIAFELRLFTGMVARIPTMGVKNMWQLPVCFIGNALGMALIAVIVRFTFLGDTVAQQGAALIGAKLADEQWAVKCFFSAIMCGILITFSILAGEAAHKKNLSATLGVILPVLVFAFCGFDHSVANWLYLYFYGEATWQIVAYILISIVGNVIGGVLFPAFLYVRDHYKNK